MNKTEKSNYEINSLIKQARYAFTKRKPEIFHEAFSEGCNVYLPDNNSLDCSNCNLVVPYSPEMLEEATELFKNSV